MSEKLRNHPARNALAYIIERIKLSLYAMENLYIVQKKYQLGINLTFATFLGK